MLDDIDYITLRVVKSMTEARQYRPIFMSRRATQTVAIGFLLVYFYHFSVSNADQSQLSISQNQLILSSKIETFLLQPRKSATFRHTKSDEIHNSI